MSAVARAIPMLPVLRAADWIPAHASAEKSILDVGSPRWVARGAVAILLALRHAQVGSGDEVMVPAFHCPSMVAPVRAAGAQAVMYAINEDLSPDLASIEQLLSSRTRALLVAHLLGRVVDLAAIRSLCEQRGIVLIEDCAHAFFGHNAAGPVGSIGHYAVASPRKFFPIGEGGLLTSATVDLADLALPAASWGRTVRSALGMIDTAVAYRRLRVFAPVLGIARTMRSALRRQRAAPAAAEVEGDGADSYDIPLDVRRSVGFAGGAGRFLFNVGLIDARRRNYARLAAAIGGASGARLLDMPPLQTFVPYVVPVLLSDPQRQFASLKQLGVPMWRWEYSPRGLCKITDHYSQALIQLPCHQALLSEDLDEIARSVASVCQ